MVLDFNSFKINESSLKKVKKELHGVLNHSDRKRMREELKHNIITFKFRKRNGEIRKAHGTLHSSYLPKLKGGAPRPEHQMVYYDLDKEGWRSFRSFTFIKILDIKPVGGTSVSKPSSVHSSGTVKPSSVHAKPASSKSKSASEEDEDDEMTKPVHTHHEEKEVEKEEKVMKKVEHEDEHEEKHHHKDEHEEKHHDDKHEDEHKKEYEVGDKIPEDELKRRSTDFRKGSRKNKFTHESNDDFKKGKLKKDKDEKDEDE